MGKYLCNTYSEKITHKAVVHDWISRPTFKTEYPTKHAKGFFLEDLPEFRTNSVNE